MDLKYRLLERRNDAFKKNLPCTGRKLKNTHASFNVVGMEMESHINMIMAQTNISIERLPPS